MNTKQTIFVNEYLKSWNSSEAARKAGYNGKSNVIGPRLLADVSIKREIDDRIAELKMSADEVLLRLAEQARGAYADYLTPDGVDLKRLLDDGKGHLIKKLKPTKDGQEIEFYDGQVALINIAKHHGLITDKIELKLEKELEAILTKLEQSLDADTFQRVLQALSARRDNPEISGATFTEDTE